MKHINISIKQSQFEHEKLATSHNRTASVGRPASDPRWQVLDLVRISKARLNLKDRDIAILRGLLSLLPASQWGNQMIVFASNRIISTRCDGVEERTLRRRLNRLAESGLILRKSSPSGKRYQVKDHDDLRVLAYGLDLTPLYQITKELEIIAADTVRTEMKVKSLKSIIRDRLYHHEKLFDEATSDFAKRALRRKMTVATLQEILQGLDATIKGSQTPPATRNDFDANDLTATDSQIVRHIQSSYKEDLETESKGSKDDDEAAFNRTAAAKKKGRVITNSDITVFECMEAATTARSMSVDRPQTWSDVQQLANNLAPAIGLHPKAVEAAKNRLGEYGCALAILGLVEAYERIKCPQAYLNALTKKAQERGLDCVKMFWSLTKPKVYRTVLT